MAIGTVAILCACPDDEPRGNADAAGDDTAVTGFCAAEPCWAITLRGSVRVLIERPGGIAIAGVFSGRTAFAGADGAVTELVESTGGSSADSFVVLADRRGVIERVRHLVHAEGTSVHLLSAAAIGSYLAIAGTGSGRVGDHSIATGADETWVALLDAAGRPVWSGGGGGVIALEGLSDRAIATLASPEAYDLPAIEVLEIDGSLRWSLSAAQVNPAHWPPRFAALAVDREGDLLWVAGSYFDAFALATTTIGRPIVADESGSGLFLIALDAATGEVARVETAEPVLAPGTYASIAVFDLSVASDGGVLVAGGLGAPPGSRGAAVDFGGITIERPSPVDGFAARLGPEGWEWAQSFGVPLTLTEESQTLHTDSRIWGIGEVAADRAALFGEYWSYIGGPGGGTLDSGPYADVRVGGMSLGQSGEWLALLDASDGRPLEARALGPLDLVEDGRFGLGDGAALVAGLATSDGDWQLEGVGDVGVDDTAVIGIALARPEDEGGDDVADDMWALASCNAGVQELAGVAVGRDGIWLAGTSEGDMTIVGPSGASAELVTEEKSLPFIVHVDPVDGTPRWARVLDDARTIGSPAATPDGGVVVPAVGLVQAPGQAETGFVRKLDGTGARRWDASFDGTRGLPAHWPSGIAVDADGAVYAAGGGVALVDEQYKGERFVARIELDGAPAWVESVTLADEGVGTSINYIAAGAGRVAMAMTFREIAWGGVRRTAIGEYANVLVPCFDALSGDVLWQWHPGIIGSPTTVAVIAGGGVAVTLGGGEIDLGFGRMGGVGTTLVGVLDASGDLTAAFAIDRFGAHSMVADGEGFLLGGVATGDLRIGATSVRAPFGGACALSFGPDGVLRTGVCAEASSIAASFAAPVSGDRIVLAGSFEGAIDIGSFAPERAPAALTSIESMSSSGPSRDFFVARVRR